MLSSTTWRVLLLVVSYGSHEWGTQCLSPGRSRRPLLVVLASLERCFVLLGDAYRYEHTDLRACLVLADSAASLWVVWMLPILGSTHRRVRFVWRKPLVLPVRLCVAAARLPSVLLAMLLVWPWVFVFRDVGSRTVTMEPHGASCLSFLL